MHPGRHSRTCTRYNQGLGVGGGGGGGGDKRDLEGWGEKGEKREVGVSEIWIGTCTMQSMMVQSMMVRTSAVSFFLPRLYFPYPFPSSHSSLPFPPPPFPSSAVHSFMDPTMYTGERAVQCRLNWMVSATPSL